MLIKKQGTENNFKVTDGQNDFNFMKNVCNFLIEAHEQI